MMSIPALTLTGTALFGGLRLYRRKQSLGSILAQTQSEAVGYGDGIDQDAAPADGGIIPQWIRTALVNDDNRQWTIIGLTGVTTAIHLVLGLQGGGVPIFVLNGAGFAAILAARYAIPQLAAYRGYIDDLFMAYTGTTIIAYFVVLGPAGLVDPLGMVTKLAELGLLGALWMDSVSDEIEAVS